MAFGRFRSFRSPMSKRGATSNTTGSRIRSSARTLREKSASLVQQARSKVKSSSPVQGYQHATAQRKVAGSASAAGETARKRAYHATTSDTARRQAAYQGIKNAPSPSGASFGYRAGYRLGAQVAAGKYKSNVTTQNSRVSQATHMQPKGLIPNRPTGLENRLERGLDAMQRGSRVAAVTANRKIGSATRKVQELKSITEQGFSAGRTSRPTNRSRDASQMNKVLGGTRLNSAAAGVMGYSLGFGVGRASVSAQNTASRVRAAGKSAVGRAQNQARSLAKGAKGLAKIAVDDTIFTAKGIGVELKYAGRDISKGVSKRVSSAKLKARGKAISAGRSVSEAYNSTRREAASIRSSIGYGFKSGVRMPDASVKQAYEAQRGFNSKAGSASFAAAYGAGKSLNRAGRALSKASSSARSAVSRAPQAAGDAIINTVERAGRFVAPAARKLGEANLKMWQAPVNAAKAAYREVYTAPRQSYAKKMFDTRNAQVHAEYAAGIRDAKESIRQTDNRRKLLKSTYVGRMKGQTTRWGERGGVTPTGRSSVAQQVRYQNFMDRRAASRSTGKAKPTSINTSQNLSKFNASIVNSLRQQQQQRTSGVSSTVATPTAPVSKPQANPNVNQRSQRAATLLSMRREAQSAKSRLSVGGNRPIGEVRTDTISRKAYEGTPEMQRVRERVKARNKPASAAAGRTRDPGLEAFWAEFDKSRAYNQNVMAQAKGAAGQYAASQQAATQKQRKTFSNRIANEVMSKMAVDPTPEQVMGYARKEDVLKLPSGMTSRGRNPKRNSKAWKARVENIIAFNKEESRKKVAGMPQSWRDRRSGKK
jgi:hypothetical protein